MATTQNLTKKRLSAIPARRRQIFLRALARLGCVTRAAAEAGLSRVVLYTSRSADRDFAEQWTEAIETFADSLESEAFRRGVQGVDQPVYQGGQLVGHVRRYSDSLLLAMLRARIPAYRASAPSAQAAAPALVERDPALLAKKIAFALAVAQKRQSSG
ncbi:terminase [Candidatus Magnetaquicoccus inordinatus]|uniref:terminase n=1 Tax=Candidatus Magnetaquicoccus inordinatus TaxID=2496818 RepID=UPI00102CE0BF|nr:terminase [Candidatus Magnetaquicoccus inordinatus]